MKDLNFYTQQNGKQLYYKYYLYNLKQCTKFFNYQFIPIKDINGLYTRKSWSIIADVDNFLNDSQYDKLKLAKSIIKNGTYWPLQIFENNGSYDIFEGFHRLISLKLAQQHGLIDDTFKILCMILPQNIMYKEFNDREKYLINPIKISFLLKEDDINLLDESDQMRQLFTRNKNQYLQSCIGFKTVNNLSDLYIMTDEYIPIIRDLSYKYSNIKPNKILNNERLWNEFINTDRYIRL